MEQELTYTLEDMEQHGMLWAKEVATAKVNFLALGIVIGGLFASALFLILV